MTLKPFGDHDVTVSAIRIVGAGDGLSDALELDPVELEHGDKVYVVLGCIVTKVGFDPIKDSDDLRRVHTIRATFGRLVDEPAAHDILLATKHAIEEARGIQHLPGTSDDDG